MIYWQAILLLSRNSWKKQLFNHFEFSWVLNLPYGLFFMAHPWLIQIPVGLHIGPKIDRWHSSTCQKGLGFSDVHKFEGHMRQVAAAIFFEKKWCTLFSKFKVLGILLTGNLNTFGSFGHRIIEHKTPPKCRDEDHMLPSEDSKTIWCPKLGLRAALWSFEKWTAQN